MNQTGSADPYALLGVGRDANDRQIKDAFRSRVRELHPDVNPTAAELFKRVVDAHTTLSDPELRAAYDRACGPDLFDDLFGSGPASYRTLQPLPDGRAELHVSFWEVAGGAALDVADPATGRVHRVERIGAAGGIRLGGREIVVRVDPWPPYFLDAALNVHVTLPVTAGERREGVQVAAPAPSGSLVKVRIPAGAVMGAEIRCRGRGLSLVGTRATDLIVTLIDVDPDAPDAPARGTGARAPRAALLRQVRAGRRAATDVR